MEIVWNENQIHFEYVDVGHTFIYNNSIYMRVTNVYNSYNSIIINAVNIESGIVSTFCDDDLVTPVVGKFVMD